MDLTGTVSYLQQVGFAGSSDGMDWRPANTGSRCSGAHAHGLTAGAAVTIAAGIGQTLATAPLHAGRIADNVRHTASERKMRRALIDAIFTLRISRTWNTTKSANLNVARARSLLRSIKHPNQLAFEGMPFSAAWCRLPFQANDLRPADTYTITVAGQPSTVVTAGQLATDHDHVDLVAK